VRISPDIGVLQAQRGHDTHEGADGQAAEKLGQEVPYAVKNAPYADSPSLAARALGRLEDDNGDGIVQDGFAKDDGVQLRVDFECVEDGEDGDGICGRQGGANRDSIDPRHLEAFEGYGRVSPQEHANDDGRDEGSGKGECQDGANVPEEVGLV
jgi:hypothetical protein